MNSMSIWEIFKSLFDYTQAFITKKPGPVIIYITIDIMIDMMIGIPRVLLLNLLDNMPEEFIFIFILIYIGFLIFLTIISNAFLIHIGHIVKDNKDIISFEKALKQRNTIDFFTQYWKESLGMILGNIVVFFIVLFSEGIVLKYTTKNYDVFASYTVPMGLGLTFIFLTLSMISYVAPYVYAGVYTADSFKEAFARVFDLISFGVWKKTLNLQYFFDISMWFVYSTMVIVMIIPLMFYAIVAPFGLIVLAIYIIQFPMFSVIIRYWR
jgi:hypothetical protein